MITEHDTLSNQVYDQIRLMIENGDLRPGVRINKREIEEVLGVSQTPINDALSRLVGEQIIASERRRGFVVRTFDCHELIDLFGLRAGVESIAARLACDRITDDEVRELAELFASFAPPVSEEGAREYLHNDNVFHRRMVELSGSAMLYSTYERYGLILKSNLQGLVRSADETLDEHRRIVAALESRDGEEAQKAVSIHILRSRDQLIRTCL